MLAGIGGLAGLYFVTLPAPNERPLLVALGIVLGWGSNVVQAEFGETSAGRKLTEKAVDEVIG